jgi:dihydrofolate synthase/folylpolyglutamate synthase
VEEVFWHFSMARRAPLLLGGHAWQALLTHVTPAGTTFEFRIVADALLAAGLAPDHWLLADAGGAGVELRLAALFTPLLGAHQVINAGCAVLTAIIASGQLPSVTLPAIQRGMAAVHWPGRLQILAHAPTIVLDGAHTPESAAVLVAAINGLWPARRVLLVCGLQGDKDIPGFVAPFARITWQAIATQSAHRRAAPAQRIATALRDAGLRAVDVVPEPWPALQRAREMATPDDLIVVTGSLYLVGEILKHWEDAGQETGSGQ